MLSGFWPCTPAFFSMLMLHTLRGSEDLLSPGSGARQPGSAAWVTAFTVDPYTVGRQACLTVLPFLTVCWSDSPVQNQACGHICPWTGALPELS